MFVRFRQTPARLQLSLVEGRRVDGKVRHEHVASLGSIPVPGTIADRVAFWQRLFHRLASLSNRVAGEEQKLLDSINARIPLVTLDEQRILQRENAETDEKLWSVIQGMNAAQAEGHKELAAKSAAIAAGAEATAADAAEKAAGAKERIDCLAKGEDVAGGLRKPMAWKDMRRILMDAGWTDADIRLSIELASLGGGNPVRHGEEFELFMKTLWRMKERAEKSSRWKAIRWVRLCQAVDHLDAIRKAKAEP